MRDERTEARHPSYVMVQFNRKNGNHGNLFGTALKEHHTTFGLKICRAVRVHDLSEDNYYGEEELIEVELSASQFTELITTMNVSSGIPATLRWLTGEGRVPEPPSDETETERVQTSFKADMKNVAKTLDEYKTQVAAILEKKTFTKADKESINRCFYMMEQHVRANLPFALEQFERAVVKVKSAAKAEVEQFTLHALVTAGIQKVQEDNGKTLDAYRIPVKALEAKKEE